MAITAKVSPVSSLARLSPHGGPWADRSACLGMRFPGTGCRACESACPVSVLQVTTDGLKLADGCTRCGRCAAACPTHALSVPGFQTSAPDDARDALMVDCAKVPGAGEFAGELRVPCLGGLSCSRLLALVKARPERPVVLMDRGWCTDCAAGGCRYPAMEQVTEVNRWLAAMGVPEHRHIRHQSRPLPLSRMPPEIPDPAMTRPMDRRGFLRQLAGQVAVAAQGADPAHDRVGDPADPDGSTRIHPAERAAILAQLKDMSPDGRRTLPPDLFTMVEIDADRCHHHGVCATTCPTGALRVWTNGDECGTRFDPVTCTGCGECERNCPEQAIRLWRPESVTAPVRPRVLSRHDTRVCGHCHTRFVVRDAGLDDTDLPACPACERSRGLLASTFERLFGRPQHPADRQPPQERESI
jgi:ferredoxin